MRIVLLVKYVPDTEEPRELDPATRRLDRSGAGELDEINSRALSWVLELKRRVGGEVIALTMGPDKATEALRQALAIGADQSVHVNDPALVGADAVQTSAVLAAALQQVGFDLVVAGDEATDGQVAAVPAMIAERLGLPHLTHVIDVEVAGAEVSASRDDGEMVYRVAAELPAVLSVRESIAEPEVPGFRGIMGAKRKPKKVLKLADLGIEPAVAGAWAVDEIVPKPARSRGQILTDDGTAARQIADYLANNQLIGR